MKTITVFPFAVMCTLLLGIGVISHQNEEFEILQETKEMQDTLPNKLVVDTLPPIPLKPKQEYKKPVRKIHKYQWYERQQTRPQILLTGNRKVPVFISIA